MRLRRLAARLCDGQAMARVIDPAIADLQHEHGRSPRPRRRRQVAAGYLGIWIALGHCVARSLVMRVQRGNPRGGGLMGRTIGLTCAVALAFTVLLSLPPMFADHGFSTANRWGLFLYLTPQALALAVPAALAFGIVYALRGRMLTGRSVRDVTILAVAGCTATLLVMEWLVPDANQAWREQMFNAAISSGVSVNQIAIPRGVNELRISELAHRVDAESVRAFHARLAVGTSALVLSALALGLTSLVRVRWVAVLLGIAMPVAYLQCLFLATEAGLSLRAPVLSIWAPNFVLTALACALLARARRSTLTMPSAGS